MNHVDRTEMTDRFNTIYLGDSLLQKVELKTTEAECQLTFNAGKVLKASGASIFDPRARFEPAQLTFHGVRAISCHGGVYRLNATVVDFAAQPADAPDHIEFSFDLTGGHDPDAFLVTIKIVAVRFEFGPGNP